MPRHDDKKQLRRLKKKVKQLGNQKARHDAKKLLRDDPTNEQLQEQTQHGKRTSQGLNGLTDALTDVVLQTKSFGEAFRQLAAVVVREIIQMTIRLLIMQALMALTGFGLAAPAAAA